MSYPKILLFCAASLALTLGLSAALFPFAAMPPGAVTGSAQPM